MASQARWISGWAGEGGGDKVSSELCDSWFDSAHHDGSFYASAETMFTLKVNREMSP